MKHYLHKFANQAAYTTAKSGQDFYLPAVSLIESGMGVIYDSLPVVPEGFVDFGLPSGTLWAQYNLGVDPTDLDSPEDWYGDYYAWGETTPRTVDFVNKTVTPACDWEHYEHANNASNKLTKYCTDSEYGDNGFVDNLTQLVATDDVAKQTNLHWSMPTQIQLKELLAHTVNSWQTNYQGIEGLNGRLFIKANCTDAFKNIDLYMSDEGLLSNEIWEISFMLLTLEEINTLFGVQDIRTMLFKDAECTIPAVYGTDYSSKVVNSTDPSSFIFVPASGVCMNTVFVGTGIGFYMWTSSLSELSTSAMCLLSNQNVVNVIYPEMMDRSACSSIRPVITPAS